MLFQFFTIGRFYFGFILCVTFVTRWSCFLTVSVELYELYELIELCITLTLNLCLTLALNLNFFATDVRVCVSLFFVVFVFIAK